MHDIGYRREAARLRGLGHSVSEVSRRLAISRSTLRGWEAPTEGPGRDESCLMCHDTPCDSAAYAALLGYYLGDGCVSETRGRFTLRVSCDNAYPTVLEDVTASVSAVRRGSVIHVSAPGCTVVQANWKHWPCLLPQHGPGRKHQRPIVLEDWQRTIVESHPGPFLRGLFHSDGSRVKNWATRPVAGEVKRYEYTRWQFSNVSTDIQGLCCSALDLVDIAWRQSSAKHISVSTRAGVAQLDDLIGPKS